MALTTIIRGKFAVGKTADGKTEKQGNFTGWNSRGRQIHVPKEMMNALGVLTDKDFIDKGGKLTVSYELDHFDIPDEDGNIVRSFDRYTAKVANFNKTEVINIVMEDDLLNIEARQILDSAVKSATLTEESVRAVLSASSLV